MNYLVTGGAGFIGSHLVEELIKSGASNKVRVYDNLTSGHESNLKPFRQNIDLIQADIRDLPGLSKAFSGVDVVFHHAALTSVPGSVADPLACNEVNITGTLNVLLAARDAGVKRVVFASSSAIYGENSESPKKEGMLPEPLSPYAASKLAGEHYCKMFSALFGLKTVCFRYFNVFGPRQDPNSQYAAVIPKFIAAAAANKQPKVFGDGEQTRDFVFVKDVVRANLLAAQSKDLPQPAIYNVGTGSSVSLNQLLAQLSRLYGRDLNPVYMDPVPGDVKHSRADISKVARELGYKPQASLETGLQAILQSSAS